MVPLRLHAFHDGLGAAFGEVRGFEVVARYGDRQGEYRALTSSTGILDLSCRGRLVLLGADRQKMLNGQVTNNVKDLRPGQGCYAVLVNAKARMLADANIYALPNELLLDLEPGLGRPVTERLEKFIIADDVQIVDASAHYGLWSVQGPAALRVVESLELFDRAPSEPLAWVSKSQDAMGELYLSRLSRGGAPGFDLFVPNEAMEGMGRRLIASAAAIGGRCVGWEALEMARIEAGIPRFGADMDESNLPLEAGLEDRAISYSKGCYSGQEVIARIRTYGQVARALRGLRLSPSAEPLPSRGTKLFKDGKDVGYLTSATPSPAVQADIALGYVRRECNGPGTELAVGGPEAPRRAVIVPLPFAGPLFA